MRVSGEFFWSGLFPIMNKIGAELPLMPYSRPHI